MGHLNRIGEGASCNNPGAEYTPEEQEFMLALDRYKRSNQRPFPSWSEVLNVAIALGWRKVAEPTELPRYRSDKRDAKRQKRAIEQAMNNQEQQ